MAISLCNGKINEQGKELLAHGTALFPAAFYHDDLRAEEVPWHWHEELEAFLVAEGQAEVMAGNERYVIKEGDGMFVNTGILHAARNHTDGECRFHSVVFHSRLVGGSKDSVFWQNYIQPMQNAGSSGCAHLSRDIPWQREALEHLERAWQSGAAERPGYEFGVREALSRLVCLLVLHRETRGEAMPEKLLRDEERMKQMMQYIQEHFREEITVTRIAGSASVSVSECLRCFHNTIGVTPMQYVGQYRIQQAAELLASTDRRVADIGVQCGFQDMSYFARSFRKRKGCTPSEYRKRRIHENTSGQASAEMLQ